MVWSAVAATYSEESTNVPPGDGALDRQDERARAGTSQRDQNRLVADTT
jgi:hypothetical protein